MRAKTEPGASVPTTQQAGTGTLVKVGRLAPSSAPGALMVDFDGNGHGPLAARSVVTLDELTLRVAVHSRQAVVLLFENGDPGLPIVIGLVPGDPGASLLGALLAPAPATTSTAAPSSSSPAAAAASALSGEPLVEARVDGRRVVLEGKDEIVLKCGEASITLKRDGKVILRGAYVETSSKGVNRIKGGSVKIN